MPVTYGVNNSEMCRNIHSSRVYGVIGHCYYTFDTKCESLQLSMMRTTCGYDDCVKIVTVVYVITDQNCISDGSPSSCTVHIISKQIIDIIYNNMP